MKKSLIRDFIDSYGVRSYKREDPAITELMMDRSIYIVFERKGYYIGENNLLYTEQDIEVLEHLKEFYTI